MENNKDEHTNKDSNQKNGPSDEKNKDNMSQKEENKMSDKKPA